MAGKKLAVFTVVAIAGVFVLTGPLMVSGWRERKRADASFSQMRQDLVNGDVTSAYSRTSQEFKRVITEQQFLAQMEILRRAHGRLIELRRTSEIVNVRRDSAVAVYYAKLHFERADCEFIFEFHEYSGQWQLYGYKEL